MLTAPNRMLKKETGFWKIDTIYLVFLTCYPKCDQSFCETSACQRVWA